MLKKGLAVIAMAALLAMPGLALAQDKKDAAHGDTAAAAKANIGTTGSSNKLGFALGFGLALAAFGGALSQSNAIAKAVDAVARQPEAGARIQGMMIIGLALIETLVIYMLLICFMWGAKIV
jgi:F-type H+-transporting ATPase subunit c